MAIFSIGQQSGRATMGRELFFPLDLFVKQPLPPQEQRDERAMSAWLNDKAWLDDAREQWETERGLSISTWSHRVLPLAGVVLCVHYLTVDANLGVNHDPRWKAFHLGCALLSFLLNVVAYLMRPVSAALRALPLTLFATSFGIGQALAVTWLAQSPPTSDLYQIRYGVAVVAMLLPAVIIIVSQQTPAWSLFWVALIYAAQNVLFARSALDLSLLGGIELAAACTVMGIRGSMVHEIRFVLSRRKARRLEIQMVEQSKAHSREVESFLAPEHVRRIHALTDSGEMSMAEAWKSVFTPLHKSITAGMSDIRNYTLASKDEDYVVNSALPNLQMVADLVDTYRGIARPLGDNVFAYWDFGSPEEHLIAALLWGHHVLEKNDVWNQEVHNGAHSIRRFVVFSSGRALVGNCGGVRGAREVTALGSCVNLLARLDAFTKEQTIKAHLGEPCAVLSQHSGELLSGMLPGIAMKSLRVAAGSIRSFPEEVVVAIVPYSSHNVQLLGAASKAFLPGGA